MDNFTMIIWGIIILISIIFTNNRVDRKNVILQKEIKELLSITASLKLRVFDHEKHLLNRDGVYIPQDIGENYFKQTWAVLDDETRKIIEDEYKQVCPNTIPMWKYFLYAYKTKIKVERKIELKKIDHIQELIDLSTGTLEEVQSSINELKDMMEKYSDTKKKVNENFAEKINEISKEISEVEEKSKWYLKNSNV